MGIQGLNQITFNWICNDMSDRDVKSMGMTSQTIWKVAQTILQMRDAMLENLLSFYTPTRTFNVQSLSQADVLLLGEVHKNLACLENQKSLINFLTVRGHVALIVEEEDEEDASKIEGIKDQGCEIRGLHHKENISLSGWDTQGRLGRNLKSMTDNQTHLVKVLQNRKQLCDKIGDMVSKYTEKEEQQIQQLLELLDRGQVWQQCAMGFPLATLEKFAALVNLRSIYQQLSQEQQHLKHLIRKDMVRIEFTFDKEVVYSTFDNDMELIAIYREEYGLTLAEFREIVAKEFPQRTASMIRSLQKIREQKLVRPLLNLKAVLTAGYSHLEQRQTDADDPRLNLESLYDELKHHRAVILMPTNPLAEHREKLRELQRKPQMQGNGTSV